MLDAEKARALNDALCAIDTAKEDLEIACKNGGTDEEVEACGKRYLEARDQMGAAMAAVSAEGEPTPPAGEGAGDGGEAQAA